MDWPSIIKNQEDKFYEIICSLPKKIKDFDILYKLIYEQKKFDKTNFLNHLRNYFLDNYNLFKEQLNKNIDVVSNLIYYSDKTKTDLNSFLEELEKKLNGPFLINLFINLLNNKLDLTNQTKNKLNHFLENDISYENLIRIIKNTNKNNEQLLTKFSEYVVGLEDFLKIEDTFNMTLFKMLVSQNIIKEKEGQKNYFIDLTLKKIEKIKEKFFSTDFTYRKVSLLFEDENKDIFLERICLLFLFKDININNLKNNDDYNNYIIPIIDSSKKKYNIEKEKINKLQIIIDDFSTFYPNSGKSEIEEIEKLINNMKNEKLNKLESEYKEMIKYYMDKYYKNAEERAKLKESIIFRTIFMKERYKTREDDIKIFNESKEKFNEMKNIFTENGINFNNEDILGKYIKEFNDKGDDEIKEEMLRIIDIFKIQIDEEKRDEGIYNIILLSNKDKILKISYSIKTFINPTKSFAVSITNCKISVKFDIIIVTINMY